ncbi:hypothetical protein LPTSP4_36940 [Leptospira ryugenii]|uniref:Uncharacterized protein n=1 Tax=Leptospira ryugenii TaxID=1917863 RepID=A0A2P2E5K1_9LEPT|nr:hypothetical protein [Leptospira ryugenii]GBF52155.1 hypothetical protein LPTSP4_36940 [Leptospira ryugenii]
MKGIILTFFFSILILQCSKSEEQKVKERQGNGFLLATIYSTIVNAPPSCDYFILTENKVDVTYTNNLKTPTTLVCNGKKTDSNGGTSNVFGYIGIKIKQAGNFKVETNVKSTDSYGVTLSISKKTGSTFSTLLETAASGGFNKVSIQKDTKEIQFFENDELSVQFYTTPSTTNSTCSGPKCDYTPTGQVKFTLK